MPYAGRLMGIEAESLKQDAGARLDDSLCRRDFVTTLRDGRRVVGRHDGKEYVGPPVLARRAGAAGGLRRRGDATGRARGRRRVRRASAARCS